MKFDKSDKISAPMSPTYREWLCTLGIDRNCH